MYISYKRGKNGAEYASVMVSKNVDGKCVKSQVDYLGRVIDKEAGIYQSRQRGYFTYDIETGSYGIVDLEGLPAQEPAGAPRLCLDFGDGYILKRVMEQEGMLECIEAMGTGGEDTLAALVGFCVCNEGLGMCNAETWYEGSCMSLSYPKADLRSQRISDALAVMGDERSHRDFFDAYLRRFSQEGDQLVAVDSKGVVNAIDIGLTETSNHNGEVNVELRLIMVVQLGTGMPLFFRVVPGNIVDAVTLMNTLSEVKARGLNVAFTVIDAGYCTLTNMDELFKERVNFVTRLRPNYALYKALMSENPELDRAEYRNVYNGRIVYIKRVEVDLTKTNRGYAYLCLDSDSRHKEEKRLVQKYERGELSDSELTDALDSAGKFVLVSSYMIDTGDVLDVYYSRQTAEQFFDLANGYANLTPLRAHNEETVRGMVLLTFMSSALIRTIQIRLKGTDVTFKAGMLALRNQKCRVYEEEIFIDEPKRKALQVYQACGVKVPGHTTIKGILGRGPLMEVKWPGS